jgi:hypothetical protein
LVNIVGKLVDSRINRLQKIRYASSPAAVGMVMLFWRPHPGVC